MQHQTESKVKHTRVSLCLCCMVFVILTMMSCLAVTPRSENSVVPLHYLRIGRSWRQLCRCSMRSVLDGTAPMGRRGGKDIIKFVELSNRREMVIICRLVQNREGYYQIDRM